MTLPKKLAYILVNILGILPGILCPGITDTTVMNVLSHKLERMKIRRWYVTHLMNNVKPKSFGGDFVTTVETKCDSYMESVSKLLMELMEHKNLTVLVAATQNAFVVVKDHTVCSFMPSTYHNSCSVVPESLTRMKTTSDYLGISFGYPERMLTEILKKIASLKKIILEVTEIDGQISTLVCQMLDCKLSAYKVFLAEDLATPQLKPYVLAMCVYAIEYQDAVIENMGAQSRNR